MEINTRVFTSEQLKNISLKHIDAVYLGDPFAPYYEGNLCNEKQALKESVAYLISQGKKAYISTFAVPRNSDLPEIESVLRYISEEIPEVAAIEVHNTGVLQAAQELLPQIPVHMGCLANIYTDSTVNLFKSFGVKRVTPNPELCLDEMETIKNQCGIEVELLIQGRMILGISEECPVKWWAKSQPEADKEIIENYCIKAVDLESEKMMLTVRGRTTLSGKDMCMLEHIPVLMEKEFDIFHIDSSLMSPEVLNQTTRIYKDAFDKWQAVMPDKALFNDFVKPYIEEFLSKNPAGLCNGYYFRTSGSDYIPGLHTILPK